MNIPPKILKTPTILSPSFLSFHQNLAKRWIKFSAPKRRGIPSSQSISQESTDFESIINIPTQKLRNDVIKWLFSLDIKHRLIICTISNKWLVGIIKQLLIISNYDTNIILSRNTNENILKYINDPSQDKDYKYRIAENIFNKSFPYFGNNSSKRCSKDAAVTQRQSRYSQSEFFEMMNSAIIRNNEFPDVNFYSTFFIAEQFKFWGYDEPDKKMDKREKVRMFRSNLWFSSIEEENDSLSIGKYIISHENLFKSIFNYFTNQKAFTKLLIPEYQKDDNYYSYPTPDWFSNLKNFSITEYIISLFEQVIVLNYEYYYYTNQWFDLPHKDKILEKFDSNLKWETFLISECGNNKWDYFKLVDFNKIEKDILENPGICLKINERENLNHLIFCFFYCSSSSISCASKKVDFKKATQILRTNFLTSFETFLFSLVFVEFQSILHCDDIFFEEVYKYFLNKFTTKIANDWMNDWDEIGESKGKRHKKKKKKSKNPCERVNTIEGNESKTINSREDDANLDMKNDNRDIDKEAGITEECGIKVNKNETILDRSISSSITRNNSKPKEEKGVAIFEEGGNHHVGLINNESNDDKNHQDIEQESGSNQSKKKKKNHFYLFPVNEHGKKKKNNCTNTTSNTPSINSTIIDTANIQTIKPTFIPPMTILSQEPSDPAPKAEKKKLKSSSVEKTNKTSKSWSFYPEPDTGELLISKKFKYVLDEKSINNTPWKSHINPIQNSFRQASWAYQTQHNQMYPLYNYQYQYPQLCLSSYTQLKAIPLLSPQESFLNKLSSNMISYLTIVESNTKTLKDLRNKYLIKVENIISSTWTPKYNIEIIRYGSYATDLSIESSDIDILIKFKCKSKCNNEIEKLNIIITDWTSSFVKHKNWFHQVHPIYTASVPIIKAECNITDEIAQHPHFKSYSFDKDELNKIKIDITFLADLNGDLVNTSIPVVSSVDFVNHSLEKYPHMKVIILILKRYFKLMQLSNSFNGGLSSYSLFLWVKAFFKIKNINSKANNFGMEIYQFFEWYAMLNFEASNIEAVKDK